jgi:hypothetical protein
MDLKIFGVAALVLGASACTQSQPQNRSRELPSESQSAQPSKPPVQPAPRPSPTLDPKSSEAAEELVKGFARLLNEHKFDEAYMLLGPAAPPRPEFDNQFSRSSDLEVNVGAPGNQEGAAGSIYLSVPLTVSAVTGGERTSRSAMAVVRRVNDVPGSTEAQRRWHIERIDWGSAP